jgi:hypothetical protein
MALTQEQVDAWFDANPNATADEVAAAVKSVGGLEANEGLASMIANRYAIAEPEVTNYYNAYAAPKVDTQVKQDLPTFTDTITAGTPTTEDEFLSTIADTTASNTAVTGGTGNDTVVGGTTNNTAQTDWERRQAAMNAEAELAYAAQQKAAADNVTDLGNGTFKLADGRIFDSYGNEVSAAQTEWERVQAENDAIAELALIAQQKAAADNVTDLGDGTFKLADGRIFDSSGKEVINSTTADTYTATNWPTIILGTTGTDGETLTTTTTSDGTPFYLRDEDGGGMYQNPNTVESYAPFTGSDGKTYYAIYAPVFSSGKAWNETPITGYMTEAQFRAFQGGSTFGDALSNIANSPVGQFALGVLGPYGQAFNAANQASQGNYLGAFLSGTNAAQGFGVTNLGGFDIKTVQNVARGLNAIDKNDLMGALTAGSNLLGGIPGDYTTVTNLASATLALKNNDTAGFLSAMGELTGSADAKTAAAATRLLAAVSADNPNLAAIQAAANGLNSAVNKTSTTGTDTSAAITTLSAEDLAELKPGELNAYQNGGVQGLADFRRDMRLLNSLTGSGYTGDSLGGDYTNASTITGATGNDVTLPTGTQLASTGTGFEVGTISGAPIFAESANAGSITAPFGYRLTSASETDAKPTGSFYDPTTNAWFSPDTAVTDLTGNATIKTDADLFNSSLGTLDELDTTRSADEFADFLATLGITNTTQLTDSGLSNQDILDMINALDDTVTVTGATGNDTITGANANDGLETVTVTGAKGNDTLTGGTGNDTGTLSCPAGKVPNADGTACIDQVIIKGTRDPCPAGTVYDEALDKCVPLEQDPCPTGYHRDASGQCVQDECPDGYVRNLGTGACEKVEDDCPTGYSRDEITGKCIPVVTIEDKKCDPGFVYDEDLKFCVPITEEPCPTGFHRNESGSCVLDECPEGYVRDLTTGECVLPEEPCADGYHRDETTGLCVPDDDAKCETGYEKVNGTCVPVCQEGYVRNLATGACEKAEEPCPEGYARDEITGKCIPVVVIQDKKCDPGFVYDEDLKQCVPIAEEPCATGYHRDEATGLCVPDDDDKCKTGYEKVNGTCVPVCKEGYIRNLATGVCEKAEEPCPTGYERDEETGKCIPVIEIKSCPTGFVRDEETGKCVPIADEPCATGFHRDEATGLCVPDDDDTPCAEGFHKDEATGLCVPDDDEECKTGFEKVDGVCVPVCKEGYIRNLATNVCEKEEKACPPGQVKDANGKCVPITKPPVECQPGYEKVNGVCVPVCKTGFKRVNGVCVPTATTTTIPTSALGAEGEKTDPIYATGMDDFDLFATLEELLADKPDKTDKKKDSKKSKDKTKMATGGHLDDLLAEQMTVDDLLKLLR